MSNIYLNKHSICFTCLKCSHELSETIGKLKSKPMIICPNCNSNINIQTDELKREIDNVDASLKKLRKSFKNWVKGNIS